jgi:hypothetical protein
MFRYTIEAYDMDAEGGEFINNVVLSVTAESEGEALEKAKTMVQRDYGKIETVEEEPLLTDEGLLDRTSKPDDTQG